MRRSSAAATIAALLAVTSCNGDDDAAATTRVTAQSTQTSSTTAETTTETSAPPTTSAPAPTAPTTPPTRVPTNTTVPTAATTGPTTTTDQLVDERVAVLDAVEAASQARLAAVRDPFDDTKLTQLEEFFTGPQLEGWQNVIADYREQNLRQIENPHEPDAILVELASLAVNSQGTFANLQACSITAGIVVEVAGNPDGSDRVIEDRVGKNVIQIDVAKEGEAWKLQSVRTPTDELVATCD